MAADEAALERRVEELTARVAKLEDAAAVRNLQHAYGYYLDKCLYEEVVGLFADDCRVIFLGGIFRGVAGARRLYVGRFGGRFVGGRNGPKPGFLLEHPQLQDIVHVADDRTTARARFRTLMQAGTHVSAGEAGATPRQWWEGGLYENTYVRAGGVWKIKELYYRPFWHASFEEGWAHTKPAYVPNLSATFPDDPYGPDELQPDAPELWPNTDVFPFHYDHPVTGAPYRAGTP
jgi:hypothetical protein